MSNLLWEYKNKVLENTAHLKLNIPLISIEKWTLECIETRTKELIQKICETYPYPDVTVVTGETSDIIDEKTARQRTVSILFSEAQEISKDSVYTTADGNKGYVIFASKMYPEGDKEKYWFGYRNSRFDSITNCNEQYCTFICRSKKATVIIIPKSVIDSYLTAFINSLNDDGSISHYHIVLHKTNNGGVTLLLSKPNIRKIDISDYIVAEL